MEPNTTPAATTPAASRLLEGVVRIEDTEEGIFHFNRELEKLNRKAAKFGLDLITVKASKSELYWLKYSGEQIGDSTYVHMESIRVPETEPERAQFMDKLPDHARFSRIRRLELSYPMVKLGDWAVVGRIEPMTPEGNLVFTITDDPRDREETARHMTGKICCEHCKKDRQRNDSYILRNLASPVEDPEYKEVGRSCLKDFTGIDPAAALFLAKMSAWCRVDDFYDPEDPGTFRCRATGMRTRDFLRYAAFCIEQYGFISRAVARDQDILSTADEAYKLPEAIRLYEETARKWDDAYENCSSIADKTLEWIRGIEPKGNDFLHNAKLILSLDDISDDRKHLGVAAATVQAWKREQEKELDRVNAAKGELGHVGAADEKLSMILTMVGHYAFEHAYGTGSYVHLRDEQGNHLSWKASQIPGMVEKESNLNRPFHAQFKVKEHEEFRGVPQTNITHLKVLGWVDEVGRELPQPEKKAKRQAVASL